MLFMLKMPRADCYPMRQECLGASLGIGGSQRESSSCGRPLLRGVGKLRTMEKVRHCAWWDYGGKPLRTADQYSGEEHQHSTHNNLERSGKEGGIHVAVTHEADGRQLSGHDGTSRASGDPEIRNKKRQSMSDPSGGGHQPAYESPHPRLATPGKGPIVRESLGETHGNPCPNRGGEADQKSVPALVRGEGCGEQWRKSGNGAVHQPRKTRLDNLEHEQAALRSFLLRGSPA